MSHPTAAIIIIGNEILSGRTLDLNTRFIAGSLNDRGIKLKQSRIIADDNDEIIEAVLEFKSKYDYVFITGGIGPTHDDITTAAVAQAFGRPLELNKEAYAVIKAFYEERGLPLNQARKKMAYIPVDSGLIINPVSSAPGFVIENVYVMAGVPNIMQSMFEQILPDLKNGDIIYSKFLDVIVLESSIANSFESLQHKYPEVEMGSYPFEADSQNGTTLVLRSADIAKLQQAYEELIQVIGKLVDLETDLVTNRAAGVEAAL